MAVYMIADTHFGHANIIKYRPQFSCIEEHDHQIETNILRRCGKRDSLYILGDAFVGPSSFEQLREISRRVEHLHVILGNHCDERKGSPTLSDLLKVCKSVHAMRRYKHSWLTHAPLHPRELRGKINVHGHCHSSIVPDDRYFCVSCENVDYWPINFEDIRARIGKAA